MFFEFNLGAALLFAFVGGFHEGKNLDSLFGWHWRDAGLKELYNFDNERRIAVKRTHLPLSLIAFGKPPKSVFLPVNPLSPTVPESCDFNFPICGGASLDGFTAGPHDGKQRFRAM